MDRPPNGAEPSYLENANSHQYRKLTFTSTQDRSGHLKATPARGSHLIYGGSLFFSIAGLWDGENNRSDYTQTGRGSRGGRSTPRSCRCELPRCVVSAFGLGDPIRGASALRHRVRRRQAQELRPPLGTRMRGVATAPMGPTMEYPRSSAGIPNRFAKTMEFYRSGERSNPVMVSVVRSLNEQIHALAAYYASLSQLKRNKRCGVPTPTSCRKTLGTGSRIIRPYSGRPSHLPAWRTCRR